MNIDDILKKIAQQRTSPDSFPGDGSSPEATAPLQKQRTSPYSFPGERSSHKATAPPQKPSRARSPNEIAQMQRGNNAVKSMQRAIIHFANTVANDAYNSNLPMHNPQDAAKKMNTLAEPGVGSFLNFFVQNFVGKLPEKVRGHEYQSEPGTRKEKERTQTSAYEVGAVMDTIMRIGGIRNEMKEDGIWRWRTQNALKNIAGFSLALLQLGTEVNITDPTVYNVSDWRRFNENLKYIEENYQFNNERILEMPSPKKEGNARLMEAFVKKVEHLYKYFRHHALTEARIRTIIEGKMPLYTLTRTSDEEKARRDKEQKVLAGYGNKKGFVGYHGFTYYINYKDNNGYKYTKASYIPLEALQSKEAYFNWMRKMGVDEYTAINVLENIKKQLDKVDAYKKLQSELPAASEQTMPPAPSGSAVA